MVFIASPCEPGRNEGLLICWIIKKATTVLWQSFMTDHHFCLVPVILFCGCADLPTSDTGHKWWPTIMLCQRIARDISYVVRSPISTNCSAEKVAVIGRFHRIGGECIRKACHGFHAASANIHCRQKIWNIFYISDFLHSWGVFMVFLYLKYILTNINYF